MSSLVQTNCVIKRGVCPFAVDVRYYTCLSFITIKSVLLIFGAVILMLHFVFVRTGIFYLLLYNLFSTYIRTDEVKTSGLLLSTEPLLSC